MTGHQDLLETVEALMDAHTLGAVLRAMVEVCYAKRDHLLSNWQDKAQAKEWGRAAALLARVETRVEV